ncbi:LamG domain-containing protein [Haloarcula brevis]|uniref:LamG domain-containing protein n=1 Tax=Haloarcula brevis TaxID=3111453 RepID=UPI00300F7B90
METPDLRYRFEGDLAATTGDHDLSGAGVSYVDGPEGSLAASWAGYASTEFEAIGSAEPLTFCYWMRDSGTQSTWDDDLIWRITSDDGDAVGAFCDTDGEPFLFTSGSNTLDESETSVLDSEWHHIAFVYQQRRNRMQLYVDGSRDYAIEYDDDLSGMDATTLMFGNVSDGGFKQYDGEIDDFRLYRRALSAAEIRQIAGAEQ